MGKYLKAIKKRSKNMIDRFKKAFHILLATEQDSLHQYSSLYPHPQNAIDLFKEEWISRFPPPFHTLQAGENLHFEDERISWAIQQLKGVKEKTVLELGPMEGGHSYMLQKQGALSVTAIEANPRAYLKCLIVKQCMHLDRVHFLFGDFMEYLRTSSQKFDTCIASGVLYHMQSPVELIALIAQRCSQIFLWTHYYDEKICKNILLKPRFSDRSIADYQGFKHVLYRYKYGAARSWATFIGGPAKTSHWLNRQDVLECLVYFGFSDIQINFEDRYHPHGPSFALTATKKEEKRNT